MRGTQLRNWVKQFADDPQHAFPGQGQMKPEQLEIAQLKREVARLKAERDEASKRPCPWDCLVRPLEKTCKPSFQRGDSIGKVVAAHSEYPRHNWISSARQVKHSRFFLFVCNVSFDEMVDAAEIAD